MGTRATERQVNYIRILTDKQRVGIQSNWAFGGYRNPQRQALKAKYGDGYWDLTDEQKTQEWADTVGGVMDYLDNLDSSAGDMTADGASALIDSLKNGNIVWMYWNSKGVL